VFGDTEVTIKGLLFQPGKVTVRFGNSEKNQVLVEGEFVDSETVRCKTANYQAFGAMPVDLRVDINGQGWTVNKLTFSYFANTGARVRP
jgi:dynein heavy chain